jgi:hypothetical protein
MERFLLAAFAASTLAAGVALTAEEAEEQGEVVVAQIEQVFVDYGSAIEDVVGGVGAYGR